MKHASINFLFFDDLRLFEILHGFDKFINSLVNFSFISRENSLEVLICSCFNFLWVLSRFIMLREEFLVFHDKLLNQIQSLPRYFIVLSKLCVLEMINRLNKLLFTEMWSFKNGIFLLFKTFWIVLNHCLILHNKVVYWNNDVFIDVFDQGIDEWWTYIFNSAFYPYIIM